MRCGCFKMVDFSKLLKCHSLLLGKVFFCFDSGLNPTLLGAG